MTIICMVSQNDGHGFRGYGFLYCFANPRDHWHEMAVEVAFGWRGQIVTTESIQANAMKK